MNGPKVKVDPKEVQEITDQLNKTAETYNRTRYRLIVVIGTALIVCSMCNTIVIAWAILSLIRLTKGM